MLVLLQLFNQPRVWNGQSKSILPRNAHWLYVKWTYCRMTLLGREEVKIWLKTWEQLGGNWKKIPGGCLCALRGSSTDQRLKSKCISSTTPYKYGILRHHQRICRCHHHHFKTNQFKKSTKKLIFCLRIENWDQIIHFDSKPATKLWIFKLQAAKVLKTGSIQGSVCIISLMKSDFFLLLSFISKCKISCWQFCHPQVSMPGLLRFSAFFVNSAPNLSYCFFCRVPLLFFKLFWFSRYRIFWHENPPIQIHPTLQCTHCVVEQPLPLRQNSFLLLAFFKTPRKSCLDQCIACF